MARLASLFRSLPTWGFVLAGVLIAGVGLLGYSRLRGAMEAGDWSRHALEVVAQTQQVRNDLVDAETGQRGYLLTGAVEYLDPYRVAVARLPQDLTTLASLTEDNPVQRENLQRVSPLIAQKLREMEATITSRGAQGAEAALSIVRSDVGRELMLKIREQLGLIEAEERRLLDLRLNDRAGQSGQASLFIGLASLLALLAMGGSALALSREIAERLRAERKVRESEQRLAVTLSSIGDAVIATNTAGEVMFMNPVAQALTGWSLSEARRRPLREIFAIVNEGTRETVENPVAKVLREGMIVGLANHTVLIARDGRERPIDDSAAPIRDGDGEIMGVVLVFRDVSERQEATRMRESFVRAEAANQAKDEFLGILSHELRSPLTAMLGWVRVLRIDEAQKNRAIEVLERSIATQASLIRELLDVSRIVSGKLQIASQPVDLAAVIEDTVESYRPLAEEKGVTLVYDAAGDPHVTVSGDQERLRQVMGNLLENAIKFTPGGGRVDVGVTAHGGEVRIDVRDTGKGIDPGFLPHVFERFRQEDNSRTREHGGLGLGLAIVEHLVQRHGGRVDVRSDGLGKGATFEVWLPLAETAKPAAVRALSRRDPKAGLPGIFVLLVEDDSDTRDALKMLLEARGARVVGTGSVAEALALFENEPPGVIVSDISMPGEDGYSLLDAIRARGHRTPAIALTGLGGLQDRAAALRAGFNEHLTKPIDPDDLVRCLRDVAGSAS